MAAKGRSPHVIGLRDERFEEARETWCVDDLVAIERRGPGGFLSADAMHEALESAVPDLVHLRCLWGPYGVAAARWRKRTGKPLLVSAHGMLDPYALSISRWKKVLARFVYADSMLDSASAMHALNRSEANSYRTFGLANPIAIIPNGVDIHPLGERATREEKRMVFLSRIHPKKGLEELVRAWRKASDDCPAVMAEWRLDIAGWDDGGHLDGLEALVRSNGLADRIAFVGPKFDAEKRAFFDDADGFILPSFSEGLPVSVLEAWERALPVVMTDFCNLPEGFAAGAAMRTEPAVAAIARDLCAFCALPREKREEMGQKGRELVVANYSWDTITDHYLELYDWLAGRIDQAPGFVEFAD
ncbi:glycosyltransferase [Aurantiacibacter sp. D1-12]|uniref:glycosyltransferase n=1 Tax=Aurantiacibacter sp. D1-12 TaxID=2993658 RepID=UPI00237C6BC9|nr:glycosyltransferase [Aurantiacibacter sp. D1-12]MDE1466903.1 glycosyltransferase [Aurantiacibacter sp. D1-12]